MSPDTKCETKNAADEAQRNRLDQITRFDHQNMVKFPASAM